MQAFPIRTGRYGDETTGLAIVERVQAADIQPGDQVARAKTHIFQRVAGVAHHPTSVYITYEHGNRDRPRLTASWWRIVPE